MRLIERTQVEAVLDYPSLIDAIDAMFRLGCTMPVRHHHAIDMKGSGEPDATLLLMPAWRSGDYVGVKVVTVFPGNAARHTSAVAASYLLLDGTSGAPLAMIDGEELTARRTASASALASRYLSRPESASLLLVGTGTLAPHLARAHAEVRPIAQVTVWGRDTAKAEATAQRLQDDGLEARASADLEDAARGADIISCATLSPEPLVFGDWLRPGQHLDLVGAFRPDMRESDDAAVRRATVFVDTRAGALQEAGDVVQPIEAGVIAETDVAADLFDLARGDHPGRRDGEEITLFKSVGAALEDLAAAILAMQRA